MLMWGGRGERSAAPANGLLGWRDTARCAPGETKTLPSPCVSTALEAKTLPLPCLSNAFVAKTEHFLALQSLQSAEVVLAALTRIDGAGCFAGPLLFGPPLC